MFIFISGWCSYIKVQDMLGYGVKKTQRGASWWQKLMVKGIIQDDA